VIDRNEWDDWTASWQRAPANPTDLAALSHAVRRVRRTMALTGVLATCVAIFALLIVAAALRHAGNRFERGLGFVVAIGIVAAWVADRLAHRRPMTEAELAPADYAVARRSLCLRRIRFSWFASLVAVLDLIFLVPWWIGGFAIHGFGFDWTRFVTMWGPLALIMGFIIWAGRIRTRAVNELRGSTRLGAPPTE
jgi:hypothetical protein